MKIYKYFAYHGLGPLVLFKHPTKQPPFLLEERNRSRCYLGPSLTSVHQWFVSLMCTALLTLPSFPSERLSTLPFKSPDADRSSWGGNDVQRVNIHWDWIYAEYVHNIRRAWRQERHAAKPHLSLVVGAFGPAFKHPAKLTALLLKEKSSNGS